MKVSNNLQKTPATSAALEGSKSGKLSGAESAVLGRPGATVAKANPASLQDASRVDLSSRAQDIRKAKELATPSESVDEAKVARLQKLIDEGTYQVNADAIADRLLDEHMKMPR